MFAILKRTFAVRILLLSLGLSLSVVPLAAQTPKALWQSAQQAYQVENYERAAELYDSLLAQDYVSADLYYNLGNAHYQSQDWTEAILAYERALKLDPGHEDAAHNLALANARTVDRITPVPEFLVERLWNGLRDSLRPAQWAGVAVLWVWLAFGLYGIIAWSRKTQNRRAFFFLGTLSLLLGIGAVSLGYASRARIQNDETALLVTPNVYVRSAPDEGSQEIFLLHEGAKVWRIDSLTDWWEIRLADGKQGWVPREVLEII